MKRWHFYLAAFLLVLVCLSPQTAQTAASPNTAADIVAAEGNTQEKESDEIIVFSDTTSAEAYDDESTTAQATPALPYSVDDTFGMTDGIGSSWFTQLFLLPFEIPLSLLNLLPAPLKWFLILLAIAGIVWFLIRRSKRRRKQTDAAVLHIPVQAESNHVREQKTYYYDASKLINGIRQLGIGAAFIVLEIWLDLWYIAGILGVFVTCMAVSNTIIALLPHWRAKHYNPEHETTDEKNN